MKLLWFASKWFFFWTKGVGGRNFAFYLLSVYWEGATGAGFRGATQLVRAALVHTVGDIDLRSVALKWDFYLITTSISKATKVNIAISQKTCAACRMRGHESVQCTKFVCFFPLFFPTFSLPLRLMSSHPVRPGLDFLLFGPKSPTMGPYDTATGKKKPLASVRDVATTRSRERMSAGTPPTSAFPSFIGG